MNFELAEPVLRTLLYEGYALYPYRPSLKNRRRWTFGDLGPGGYCRAELLVEREPALQLEVRARFLELGHEVVEREIGVADPRLQLELEPVRDGLARVRATVRNGSPTATMGSVHLVLGCASGRFVSATDPPEDYRAEAAACRQVGVWPVLVGSPERRDLALASPIILADFPRIAPESRGELFDGTEIDEILSLRIRTLTDEEKRLARASDPRVARLLDRVEAMDAAAFAALHGRSVSGTDLRPGDQVRLRPTGRADAFDLLLAGKAATVLSIEEDVDGQRYVAVTIDDDPGREWGVTGQPGHRFFFRTDEVEPR